MIRLSQTRQVAWSNLLGIDQTCWVVVSLTRFDDVWAKQAGLVCFRANSSRIASTWEIAGLVSVFMK
jgi:hypothetical protein